MTREAAADVLLSEVCRLVGLDSEDARPLGAHATAVYLLPASGIVVRISSAATTPDAVRRAVAITSWLVERGFPAVEPVRGLEQAVEIGGRVASFWKHRPSDDGPTPGVVELGALLRELHDLPAPPVALPPYRPLGSFQAVLAGTSAVSAADRDWLRGEASALLDAYTELDSPLGHGHVHGDAYPGNLLGTAIHPVLGDWEETGTGPRELDLANTFQGVRFGRRDEELDAFAAAYGHDLRDWPGLVTLTAIRDLHTLTSYVGRADRGDRRAAGELARRIRSLRDRDRTARWTAA